MSWKSGRAFRHITKTLPIVLTRPWKDSSPLESSRVMRLSSCLVNVGDVRRVERFTGADSKEITLRNRDFTLRVS